MTSKNKIKKYLPPILIQKITKIRIYYRSLTYRKIIKNNKNLKNKHINEDIYIVGNGPSLKEYDFAKITDKSLFVCNDFYLHPEVNSLDIKYYINMDVRGDWFNNIKLHIDNKRLDRIKFIFSADRYDDVIKEFSDYMDNVYFISNFGQIYDDYNSYLDISKTTLHIINVLQGYLISANYMGFSNAYLIGFDFNVLAFKTKAKVTHFYDFSDNVSHTPSRKENEYSRVAFSTFLLFNALFILNNKININAYNCLSESFLDMFEFKEI